MALVGMGELVGRGRALPAFNAITLEHVEAVVEGAERARVAVVLQLSENAVAFHGGRLLPIARAAVESARAAAVDVALHLDHVTRTDLLEQAVDAGIGSVMFDASTLPYRENVEATRNAAQWAHQHGL